jgi:large subunit ribosomal protein L9
MAYTQVILKEKITGLGAEADVVKVRRGFARNFLLPQNKAMEATKRNLAFTASLKAIRAKREAEELAEAEKLAAKIKKLKLNMTLSTGSQGKAFGSITTIDIAKALEEQHGVKLDRHAIQLEKPIKAAGKFDVNVKVHSEVTCFIKLTVSAEGAADSAAEEESAKA